jgi:hypothetical protein
MNDKQSISIRKMDDGTFGVMAQSARHADGSAPLAYVSIPADVFALMVREISDPAFADFQWSADSQANPETKHEGT